MFVPFDQLPDQSRVWIYPSNRRFTPDELSSIREKAEAFLKQWTAHGAVDHQGDLVALKSLLLNNIL
ncbi:MAG: ABC transporter ATPase, partial [Bacteroidetes bacterium]|nr:ABC transporter ATPase [Bacteroidota bacterium]